MVVPDTLDAHPSRIRDSIASFYSYHLNLFRVVFVQALSHATLGAFFVQLAGAASFLAFFDVIRPKSDLD